MAYGPGTGDLSKRTLNWVDRQGKVTPAIPEPLPMGGFVLSPKELKVAVVVQKKKGESDIWVYDLSGKSAPYPVTGSGTNTSPVWTRDGRHIVFNLRTSDMGGSLRRIVADGSTLNSELLFDCRGDCFPISFGPRDELIYNESGALKLLDPTKRKEAQPLLAELMPSFPGVSPDGHFITFASRRTGTLEIWVAEYPDLKGLRRVSLNGGTLPSWSPDSRELYYREGANKMMAVGVRLQQNFDLDPPKELFAGNSPAAYIGRYAAAPDGRFLMVINEAQPTGTPPTQQINIVLNWFEELKQKVPAGKR